MSTFVISEENGKPVAVEFVELVTRCGKAFTAQISTELSPECRASEIEHLLAAFEDDICGGRWKECEDT